MTITHDTSTSPSDKMIPSISIDIFIIVNPASATYERLVPLTFGAYSCFTPLRLLWHRNESWSLKIIFFYPDVLARNNAKTFSIITPAHLLIALLSFKPVTVTSGSCVLWQTRVQCHRFQDHMKTINRICEQLHIKAGQLSWLRTAFDSNYKKAFQVANSKFLCPESALRWHRDPGLSSDRITHI